MNKISIRLIQKSEELPEMVCNNFFHSIDFFLIAEKTSGYTPLMAVAEDKNGNILAHLLAMICRHGKLFPPYMYTHGRVYGEGEYAPGTDRERIFGMMLKAVTQKFNHKLCLYIEFSDMSNKMFAYRHFRKNGYFPIPWQEIHNSLHSLSPEKRISDKTMAKIETARKHGVYTREIKNEEELTVFYKLLRNYFRFKTRRSIPQKKMFSLMNASGNSKTFVSIYKNKIIGGCVCIYSGNNAYMWYLASKCKTYIHLSPSCITVWSAIKYAYNNGYDHIYFLDAGLPFRNNPFREFILSFGGKPVAKYRWFRLPISCINNFLSWCYNDK